VNPIHLTLKNYRCFADSDPTSVQIDEGFTSLVGPNNAGKSTLLRFFFEFRSLFRLLSAPSNLHAALIGRTSKVPHSSNVLDFEEIFCNINSRNIKIELTFNTDPDATGSKRVVLIIEIRRNDDFSVVLSVDGVRYTGGHSDPQGFLLAGSIRMVQVSFLAAIFNHFADTLYVGPFRNAVNVGSEANYFDIPIGQAFVSNWRTSKTGAKKKPQMDTLELTEDVRRVFGFEHLEINSSDDNKTLQLFINRKPYFLEEVGSGLSHFIIVLAHAAFRRPSFILIDEPEMGLHPSLQLDFLTTLAKYATQGVIFSTHSMGLARASSERIYTLRKSQNGSTQCRPLGATSRLAEFLGELSFSGYQELGFNTVLLVEGATEVRTFQQLLRKYGLDHKIVLLPLGGAQLINAGREAELGEIKRISPNIYAIIDSERDTPGQPLSPDRSAFVEICNNLGISSLVLERRATENYFCDRAVKASKGPTFVALGPYEKLGKLDAPWSKSENWKIAAEMTKDEMDPTDLGKFLTALAEKLNKNKS
jgi:ABC-type cobalamin/Fe3+-siderophores transport system ATPase subunit